MRHYRLHLRKFYVISVILLVLFVIVLIIRNQDVVDDLDRKERLGKIADYIKNHGSFQACKQPQLPVYPPELMKYMKEVPPIDCSNAGEDWVTCENTQCFVKDKIKTQQGPVQCSFTDRIRVNDFKVTSWQTTHSDAYYKLEASDVVSVSCSSQYSKWSSILTGIRYDKEVHDRTGWNLVPKDGSQMNVLMFGFDSLSRNTVIRKLPKSYMYLTKVIGAQVLQGYNIVGDGTPQALIPILTGKTELELPDTRKRLSNSHYVNVYPFIWNDYRKNGYVTAFLEDCPSTGTFTYRMRGFDQVPTDHYMRPYYTVLESSGHSPKYCAGGIPKHKIMLQQIKNFFSVYRSKPKFLFGFHGELSHDDYNLIGAADEDVYQFFKTLKEDGVLEDTILIFMADHGHRFAEVRNTLQGKQEERLPFFSFAFPKRFKEKYPNEYKNFQSNLDKLSTPFDIYATLYDILYMKPVKASLENRSISLFSKIPAERSCANAFIEPHWCACLEWNNVSMTDPVVEKLKKTFEDTVNTFTSKQRNMCAKLKVKTMHTVLKMQPNENLVKFNKNADIDGFVADLSAKMSINTETYQIKVETEPGNSLFEASITRLIKEDQYFLKITDISRINMYGDQARCVLVGDVTDLRKYCYCIN